MIELDVYYFHWLGTVTSILEGIAPGDTVGSGLQRMLFARLALEGFTGDIARAFPLSADSAAELLSAISAVVPPIGSPIPNLNAPIQQHQITRMGALARALAGSLRDEAKRAYVLKVEDQRCLSSHSLIEKIEDCYSKEAWTVICDDAKRELEESGKCLALERYTRSRIPCASWCRMRHPAVHREVDWSASLTKRKRDWGFYLKTLADNGADAKLIAV